MSEIEQEFLEGYFDGRDPDSPKPSGNRHPAYCHSWEVGRAEIEGRHIPAHISRAKAEKITRQVANLPQNHIAM